MDGTHDFEMALVEGKTGDGKNWNSLYLVGLDVRSSRFEAPA